MTTTRPRFGVSSDKSARLAADMERLEIYEDDLLEKFVRGAGAGGQKVNKTSSAVYLKHVPTGTEVKVHSARSQALNRFLARRMLVDRIDTERQGKQSAEAARVAKVRRQKRKRSKRAKDKMLDAKHKHSEKKQRRTSVRRSDTHD
ncbi:MAG: peptide chain release factor-like protein [Myxococcota bacterium]